MAPLSPAEVRSLPAPPLPVGTLEDPSASPDGFARFGRWAWHDARATGRALTPARIGVAAAFVAVLPLISFQDENLGREAPDLRTETLSPVLNVMDELGHPHLRWAAGGLWLGTLATNDTRLQDAAFTSFQSALYASTVTNVAKGLFGRARPAESDSPFSFRPFSGDTSFPSGHTTLAFALVTPWVVYYPGPITYGLLVVAAGTATARMSLERHWLTDVLAGAALGSATGVWLARRHLRQTTPLRVIPSLGPRGGVVTLSYAF